MFDKYNSVISLLLMFVGAVIMVAGIVLFSQGVFGILYVIIGMWINAGLSAAGAIISWRARKRREALRKEAEDK